MDRFRLSQGLFGPTKIRIVHPYSRIAGRTFLLFDLGGAVAIAGMAVMALAAAVRHTITSYREEALP